MVRTLARMTTPSTPLAPRLRANMAKVPAYVAGKPAVAREGLEVFKLSSNENPYPPLPSVLTAITRAAATVNRYPDPMATQMVATIAQAWGVEPENLAAATGSVRLLAQLAEITCAPGDEVVYAWRSFEAYPITVAISDAVPVEVPLTADARHDLPAMLAAITERTRLVVLCSPNNPTGPRAAPGEVEDFLAQVPGDVLVVLDEAYREFVDDPDVPDGVDVFRAHPNVVVLRTFSKAYGLAGPAHRCRRRPPRGRRHAAQGGDALRRLGHRAGRRRGLPADGRRGRADGAGARARRAAPRAAGRSARPGLGRPGRAGQLPVVPVGDDAVPLAESFAAEGLVVRAFAGAGVRITVAEEAGGERLLEVAARLRAGASVTVRSR